MSEPSREAVDEVKTEIAVIKRKCEQYWNERGIEDPEIHAILEFIHQRADGIARALDAERARGWEEAAQSLDRAATATETIPFSVDRDMFETMVMIGGAIKDLLTKLAAGFRARATAARPAGEEGR